MRTSTLLLSLGFAAALSVQSLYAQSMTLVAARDNTLYEDLEGRLSNGAGEHFFAGKTNTGSVRRGLIFFDVAAVLPAQAVIDSVKLQLNVSQNISGAQTVRLHRVLASWGEGLSHATGNEGGGAPATTGDATWLHRFFDSDSWTNAGGDFGAAASASAMVGGFGFYTWGSTPQLVTEVQSWLQNPAENFGWIVIGNEASNTTAKRFDSRQLTTAASRPALTIHYHLTTAVEHEQNGRPLQFHLAQNFPNPFNPTTSIRFYLPKAAPVTVVIFDLAGRDIETLIQARLDAGEHALSWNAAERPSGIYFCRLQAGEFKAIRKLVLSR